MKLETMNRFGWITAAALSGIILGSGFQGGPEKTAVVDIAKIVEASEFGKQNQDAFTKMKGSRETVLEFIDQYRVLTSEQATRIRDLSVKEILKADETAELARLKSEVILADKRSKELSTKTNLTPEERNLIQEYASRSQNMEQIARTWFREFTTELQVWTDKQKLVSIDRARAAITEVAKAGAYTIVFEVGVAPYGANDLSDAALKAMNAKK